MRMKSLNGLVRKMILFLCQVLSTCHSQWGDNMYSHLFQCPFPGSATLSHLCTRHKFKNPTDSLLIEEKAEECSSAEGCRHQDFTGLRKETVTILLCGAF